MNAIAASALLAGDDARRDEAVEAPRAGVPLAPLTWFRVGGRAETLAQPAGIDALSHLLRTLPLECPVFVLGAGSNLIVRDGGIDGLVIRLGKSFAAIAPDGDGIVAGGGASDALVARRAADAGLAGLEFLAGIPGTIGGAVAMNAGAYGGDIASVLDWAEIVGRDGAVVRLPAEALGFAYRGSTLPPETVVVRARLRAVRGDAGAIASRIAAIRAAREATQPVKKRTGGSTFRNPDPSQSSLKAWELIDAADCRGLAHGGAQVSRLHTNFLLNTGGATASDLETLGEIVRERVRTTSAVELAWEIKRVGRPVRVGGAP